MKEIILFLLTGIFLMGIVVSESAISSEDFSGSSGGGHGGYLMTEEPEIHVEDICTRYAECENGYYLKECRMTMTYSGPICEEVGDNTNDDGSVNSGSGHGLLCKPGTNELECVCRDDGEMKKLCEELDEYLKTKGIVNSEFEKVELNVKQVLKVVPQKVISGNYIGEDGGQIKIQRQSDDKIRLEVGGVGVDCNLEMTQEQIQNKIKLNVKLNNGKNAEIKIMPDVASRIALQRLRLNNCNKENGCSIVLKEVGLAEQIKVAYEIKVQKQAKVFGLFGTQMRVQAQVDAGTGEILLVKKPWWAFLASEI